MKKRFTVFFLSSIVLLGGTSVLYADDHYDDDYGTNCPAQYPSSCGESVCDDEAPPSGNGKGSCVKSHYCCATGFGAHCKYRSEVS